MRDCEALVEACIFDGMQFGAITREVRNEWKDVNMRESIIVSLWALKAISDANPTTALAAAARREMFEWRRQHPLLADIDGQSPVSA